MGELRRPAKTPRLAFLLSLILVISSHVGTAAASASGAGNATVDVYNPTNETIYARLVDMTSGTVSVDYAIPASGTVKISLERHKRYALFFATGCSEDKEGRLKDCLTGICPESGCTVTDPPVAATVINYNNGRWTIDTVCGYNVGVRLVFECADCNCPSISCIISPNKCPASTIVEGMGSPMACKAGDGVPSCQSDPMARSTGCFDNAIVRITLVSLPKE